MLEGKRMVVYTRVRENQGSEDAPRWKNSTKNVKFSKSPSEVFFASAGSEVTYIEVSDAEIVEHRVGFVD